MTTGSRTQHSNFHKTVSAASQSAEYKIVRALFSKHHGFANKDIVVGVCLQDQKTPYGGNKKRQFPYYDKDQHGLCLLTGKQAGIFVLDLDVLKPIDDASKYVSGVEWWHEETASQDWPATIVAQSPSGGIHLYFRYTDYIPQNGQNCMGTNKDGKIIKADIRSTGGHIMIPPTSRFDPPPLADYKWIRGPSTTALGSAPEFVITRFVEHRNHAASSKKRKNKSVDFTALDENEHHSKVFRVAAIHPEPDPHLERDLRLLGGMLDPEKRLWDRNTWRDVGFALHHATLGHAVGLKIWKELSFKVPAKYNEEETTKQWESFQQDVGADAITIRSLYYWAREDNPLKFAMIFPPPFADPNHKVFFGDFPKLLHSFLATPHTVGEVWQALATLLYHAVGFDRTTRTVYVKSLDSERGNVYFLPEKLAEFRSTHMNEVIRWKKNESEDEQEGNANNSKEDENDEKESASDDDGGEQENQIVTLTKVFDHIKAPLLYYGEVSQRPWNPRYPDSYPSPGIFNTFCGFSVAKEAENRDMLGTPIKQKYIDALHLLFRIWAGGTGFDQDTPAPTPGDRQRILPADSDNIKQYAKDHEYYWAYRVQLPNKPPGIIFIIFGFGNCWKSAGVSGLLRMFGPRHCRWYTTSSQFDEKFTGPLGQQMFRCLEEGGDWLNSLQESRMKAEADADTLQERLMQREPREVKSCMGYIIPTNSLKGIQGDHSSGNRKYKVTKPLPLYSTAYAGRWYGNDPDNLNIDAAKEKNAEMLYILLEDPEFPVEAYQYFNNLDIGNWKPSDMKDSPETQKLKRCSTNPVVLFLKYLGEEYPTNVFCNEENEAEDKSTRELRALESLHTVFQKLCKANHLKAVGEGKFKEQLIELMQSVGVKEPYVLVPVHREQQTFAASRPQKATAMTFYKLTKSVTKSIIQQEYNAEFEWPTLAVAE